MARGISISSYTYELPDARIAQFPLADRAASKLLHYRSGVLINMQFRDIPRLLSPGNLLVFNTTKVVSARILFEVPEKQKPIEIFILEPKGPITMEQAMLQQGYADWKCLVGNNKAFTMPVLRKEFVFNGEQCFVEVSKPVTSGDAFDVHFSWSAGISFSELLETIGRIPLPPYMKRAPEQADSTRYQTVYAKEEGSVAAPTAGLHFTQEVIDAIRDRGVDMAQVSLHVGAGTFRPVKAETMAGHEMHAEEISVSRETIDALMHHADNIVAVGTTSMRTLESLFWIGLKWRNSNSPIVPEVLQWDAYDMEVPADFSYVDALQVIKTHMQELSLEVITTKTQLLIAPGYIIRSAKGLITNFHQPGSTLLLLVATFIGEDWKYIYNHALQHDYRFLSYGDSSLLWRS